jgi:hypothetical protein
MGQRQAPPGPDASTPSPESGCRLSAPSAALHLLRGPERVLRTRTSNAQMHAFGRSRLHGTLDRSAEQTPRLFCTTGYLR